MNLLGSADYCGFMTGIFSHNSHLTPIGLLHTKKKTEEVLPNVFKMAFPASPFKNDWLLLYIGICFMRVGHDINIIRTMASAAGHMGISLASA